MNWLLSLWTWKAKAGLAVALVLGIAWYIRHETTKAYERGAADKQELMFKDEAQRIERASAAERAQLAQERAELQVGQTVLASDRASLSAQRRQLATELNRGIGLLASRDLEIRNELSTTADTDLVSRYRDALGRARAAEAIRAAGSPQP